MSSRNVIMNVTYLDTQTLEVKENQTIVMENEVFTWIGDNSDFQKQEDDMIINGEGKFAIPGLMDMHVHLTIRHEHIKNPGKYILRKKEDYNRLVAVKHVAQYLKIGVTTVRGCGGYESLASLRQLVDEGVLPGPRMKLALRAMMQPGNQEYFGQDAVIDANKEREVISGRDGVMHAVRQRRSDGADHIKITTTGGVLHGKTSDVNLVLWSDDELDAMVKEAERLGMYIAAHAHATAGINAAVRNGVRTIEHSTILDDETINLMLERGTFITPTLSAGTYINNMDEGTRNNFPPEVINKWTEVSAKMVESHTKAFQKGVPLTLGTDAPVAGEHAHTNFEMKLMVDLLGMKPYEVIQSGTIISARAMKMEDMLGSIAIGKYADLILLEKDPKNDIDIFMEYDNFTKVIKGGKVVAEKGKILNQ